MLRVLLTDCPWNDTSVERSVLAEARAELILAERSDAATLASAAAGVDGILTCWAPLPAPVLEAAANCGIVARLGVGLDNIDIAAASRRGMVVCNVPDYCRIEAAEHALALILALGRKVAFFHHETKAGRYDLKAGAELRRLAGQTVGIVGYGKIGREVAVRGRALGFRVLACGRPVSEGGPPRPTADDVEWRNLDGLLAESDYISLHLPLIPETRRIIGVAELARMKPSAYLVNTSRGGLIDHQALAAALSAGMLAGAALDVQDPEPPDLSQPPFNDPRVIVTPHAAFLSRESLTELRTRAARQVVDFFQGRRPAHAVN
jgi:D-3-phosphoglycerate dehydrogenase